MKILRIRPPLPPSPSCHIWIPTTRDRPSNSIFAYLIIPSHPEPLLQLFPWSCTTDLQAESSNLRGFAVKSQGCLMFSWRAGTLDFESWGGVRPSVSPRAQRRQSYVFYWLLRRLALASLPSSHSSGPLKHSTTSHSIHLHSFTPSHSSSALSTLSQLLLITQQP